MIHGHIKTTVMDYGVPEVRSELCIIIVSCERLELRALEISEEFRLLSKDGGGVYVVPLRCFLTPPRRPAFNPLGTLNPSAPSRNLNPSQISKLLNAPP